MSQTMLAQVRQLTKMLNAIDKWIDTATAFAKTKSFDPETLLTARLAPDAFPLMRQIQTCCDNAKLMAARLANKEAPKHPDTDQSLAELKARIGEVVTYLDGFTEADFAGSETRRVVLPFLGGKAMDPADYLREFAIPNFYFHVTMTYAILRHNGVELGKMDYISSLTLHDA